MVTPSQDSRVRLGQPTTQKRRAEISSDVGSVHKNTAPEKPAGKHKKGNANAVEEVGPNGEPFDYDQDSTNTNGAKDKKKNCNAESLKVLEYFEDPVWKEGDLPGTAFNYKCKWCLKTYHAQLSSQANLKTHRDGLTQADKNQKGCAGQEKAKKAGVELPPLVAEKLASKKDDKQTGLTVFINPAFVNQVLNQLLMMWQIRQALPWSWIKDPFLQAAFQFPNPKAVLYRR
ncbi:hypothetical protein PTTG_06253 [Puccinia triticina 1-1 BBBD Race 1]|uniref:Uncharacterized protein n=1 Tax=Puccinia triticina (isolate 1-1 / race 1 (BBBD)) TaxID=630390 RepID=A0A180GMZ2_PUCT1|nr:hypothetical protein PTTG_06253 [Puccinia triticina 1-1 BBBD Race 1]